MNKLQANITLCVGLALTGPSLLAASYLVEAETFQQTGGWKTDTQFIEIMGSPYLLAHGLGQPVPDATTVLSVAESGSYHLWVRTKDWVAPWGAPGTPGKFQVLVNGKAAPETFGTKGAEWHWQQGGTVSLSKGKNTLALKDLAGFNGRCDAIYLSTDATPPPNGSTVLSAWRKKQLGLPPAPIDGGTYELVIVGGGYAGMCAAVSAARMGIPVALIQNRGVLGGNGSAEVRVWAKGNTPSGLYPVGDIVQELTDHAKTSPGTYEEFGDQKKEAILRAEPNLSLFFHHHAFAVNMEGSRIASVVALDVKNAREVIFHGRTFADCTGHGYIARKAGADASPIYDGVRMGMSNMWNFEHADSPQPFPAITWGLDLDEGDFPYPRRYHAPWFWESGYKKHPLDDLEHIRDWNLRANFGAWHAIKNKQAYASQDPGKTGHKNARLKWMAYIGGTRETQQFLGDVILSEEDINSKRSFPDGTVLTTWSIDLHYPQEQYLKKFPDNPFISKAVHGRGVDRARGYAVPYRCFYSRNIENLFLAGRNVSVTHEALGTVRVMKTGGMMGVVVGKAAALCSQKKTTPRGVYQEHLDDLIALCDLPGYARRASLDAPFVTTPPEGYKSTTRPRETLPGLLLDDNKVTFKGAWKHSTTMPTYYNQGYHYSAEKVAAGTQYAEWTYTAPGSGLHTVRMRWCASPSRATSVPVTLTHALGETTVKVNQRQHPKGENALESLGEFALKKGETYRVRIDAVGADGHVIADLIQIEPKTKKQK